MPWISPLVSFITDPFSHTFYITRDGCPLSGREISKMLADHGIKHDRIGMYIDPEGDINLNVNKSQAGEAQALFDQYGIEVSPRYEAKSRTGKPAQKRTAKRPPAQRAAQTNPFSVFDIFQD